MQLEAHFSNFCSGWGRRKFPLLSSEIERNIAKRQICHTLPVAEAQVSGAQRFLFRPKDFYLDIKIRFLLRYFHTYSSIFVVPRVALISCNKSGGFP